MEHDSNDIELFINHLDYLKAKSNQIIINFNYEEAVELFEEWYEDEGRNLFFDFAVNNT